MKTFYKYILLFITFFYCSSCSNNNKEAGNIIKEWMGKVIIFPDIKPYTTHLNLKDSLKYVVPRDKTHKILLYVDSTGCTSCKIKSYIWKTYIEKIYSQVDFLFYIKPKIKEEILSLLEHDRFNYPIFIDDKDELNKLNRFPNNSMFQCFLLDKDNKVLAIGNPAHNFKIWELYKQIINGEISDKPPSTTVEPESTEIELNDLQVGKTSETVFSLKNTGKEPLIIQTVNASCGCTVPEWDKQPVTAGKSAKIKVRITPEEKGYFNKTVTVHCNIEEGQILLKVNGTVE